MQPKFRLYCRTSRSSGTYCAQDCATGTRESPGTKIRAEADKLLQAKNVAHAQPTLSRDQRSKVQLISDFPRISLMIDLIHELASAVDYKMALSKRR